jgi:hypothetical protein
VWPFVKLVRCIQFVSNSICSSSELRGLLLFYPGEEGFPSFIVNALYANPPESGVYVQALFEFLDKLLGK